MPGMFSVLRRIISSILAFLKSSGDAQHVLDVLTVNLWLEIKSLC